MVAPSTYKKHGCYRNRRKTNCNLTWRESTARLCCADGATNYSLSKTFLRIAMSGLLRIRVVDNIMIIYNIVCESNHEKLIEIYQNLPQQVD